ncbi:MAG: type I 3-dehydroquinate dehydratase [Spirochaetes bacterium]|nr:type I 3-dehydroquinate dehydratase [Spirochaetota bacterium]
MICVAAADCSIDFIKKLAAEHEMIELRFDLLDISDADVREIVSINSNIIATCRPEKISDPDRIRILKNAIDAGVKYVDVEIDSSDDFKNQICTYAKSKQVKIIISYHNYEKTPLKRELEEIVEWSHENNADICKIACMINSTSDAARILSMYDYEKSVVAIGMGELGKITRIAAVKLGAPFTFAGISDVNKTAPGQISSEKLNTIFGLIDNA